MAIELLSMKQALSLTKKAAKVIDSCETMRQLAHANKYVNLARKNLVRKGASTLFLCHFSNVTSTAIGATGSRINRAKRN